MGEIVLCLCIVAGIGLLFRKLSLPREYLGGGCGISRKHMDLLRRSMHDGEMADSSCVRKQG